MRSVTKSDIRGIIVPMVTPFRGTHAGELDLVALRRLTRFLVDGGVHGLMPLGTSGEFGLLNSKERKQVVQTVVKEAQGRVPVVAGVSAMGTDNAIAHAEDARDAGADAIIATGPIYYKTDPTGLVVHYRALLDSVELPLMIYNIPGWVGYGIPVSVVSELDKRYPGRIVGVKFTTNDLGEFHSYLRTLNQRTSIMIGADMFIFAALSLGARGAVVGSANVFPKETSQIYENFVSGNLDAAMKIQTKLSAFDDAMVLGTYPAALKEALRLIGVDCGPTRRPLTSLSPKESKNVKNSISWRLE